MDQHEIQDIEHSDFAEIYDCLKGGFLLCDTCFLLCIKRGKMEVMSSNETPGCLYQHLGEVTFLDYTSQNPLGSITVVVPGWIQECFSPFYHPKDRVMSTSGEYFILRKPWQRSPSIRIYLMVYKFQYYMLVAGFWGS